MNTKRVGSRQIAVGKYELTETKSIIDNEQLTMDAEYLHALVVIWIHLNTKFVVNAQKKRCAICASITVSLDQPRRPR